MARLAMVAAAGCSQNGSGPEFPWCCWSFFFPLLTIFVVVVAGSFRFPNAKPQIRRSIVAEQVALTH
jgi:hypothetical protein